MGRPSVIIEVTYPTHNAVELNPKPHRYKVNFLTTKVQSEFLNHTSILVYFKKENMNIEEI